MRTRRAVNADTEDVVDVCCPSGLQFRIIDGNRIEVKCKHRRCRGRDSVVLHRYSIPDGKLIETLKFADPVEAVGARNFRKETT